MAPKRPTLPPLPEASSLREETLTVTAPPPLAFAETVTAHGWCALAPNAWDATLQEYRRVERLRTGQVVHLTARSAGAGGAPAIAVRVLHADGLGEAEREEIISGLRRSFRLDEDLAPFYALCRERGAPWEEMAAGLGRVLRSPTVWEDLVKTICTTNVQWGGTVGMVRRLVEAYGAPLAGNPTLRAFPSPAAVAATEPEAFAATVRMGYRAPYVHALASQIAIGALDAEALADPALATAALRKRLLRIKGVGPYAAATLLMLLGHYDELPLDTVFRSFVRGKYFGGAEVSDGEARAVYADWGQWRYLAYWFDVCRAYGG